MRGPDTPPHTRCTAIKSAFSASPEDRQPRHSVNLRFTVNFYSLFPSFLPHFFVRLSTITLSPLPIDVSRISRSNLRGGKQKMERLAISFLA